MFIVRGQVPSEPARGMHAVDLETGKIKEVQPLKDALDYRRWDSIAVRSHACARSSATALPITPASTHAHAVPAMAARRSV